MAIWLRCALVVSLIGSALGSLPSSATAQTEAVIDPETVGPPLPRVPSYLSSQLPSVGPQPDHPWVPNDAPWPWNMIAAQGSYKNSNGGTAFVQCLTEVGSDNPNWEQEDMRYTRWAGGSRCNIQMQAITGTSRLYQWNGASGTGPQVDSVAIGAQTEVPPGYGSGWQAYGLDYYNRTSDSQYLQIKVEVTLEIKTFTEARWNSYTQACERDTANGRILRCELWSVPFQHAPYPCGPVFGSSQGVQPVCASTSPCPSGQVGVDGQCLNLPPDLAADIEQAGQGDPEETGGNTVMGAFGTGFGSLDSGEMLLWATLAGPLEPAQANLDQVDADTDGARETAGTARDPADDALLEASAAKAFYKGAATWGRNHWDRNEAINELGADFRPSSVGTDGGSQGVDCTLFVSDAWHLGGGLKMDSQRKQTVANSRDWFAKIEGGNVRRGVPWVRVTAFFDYWVGKRKKARYYIVPPREKHPAISIGDVVQIDEGGGLGWSHASLIESTKGTDNIVQWSRDLPPGTNWHEFFYQRTPPRQKSRVRTRIVHYTG